MDAIQQYMPIIYIVVLFAIMYLILVLPQKKRDKKFREMLAAAKVGDHIVTIGGIIGTISSIKDETMTIEVGADRTKLKMEKASIKSVVTDEAN